jgi:hypothetical protein
MEPISIGLMILFGFFVFSAVKILLLVGLVYLLFTGGAILLSWAHARGGLVGAALMVGCCLLFFPVMAVVACGVGLFGGEACLG